MRRLPVTIGELREQGLLFRPGLGLAGVAAPAAAEALLAAPCTLVSPGLLWSLPGLLRLLGAGLRGCLLAALQAVVPTQAGLLSNERAYLASSLRVNTLVDACCQVGLGVAEDHGGCPMPI